jgi:outer membrane protein assembly factor BamB
VGSARRRLPALIGLWVLWCGASAADWPELRGPGRDGRSVETNLPETWSPAGDRLVWRAPYGGASGPVVLGDRVCLQNTVGDGAALQERVVCLDANTGEPVWEKRIGVNHSEAPPDRAGAATPALDPESGHVYVVTAGGVLAAFTGTGVPLWVRDLTEELGFAVAASGRIVPPVVEGRLVIVSGIASGWGDVVSMSHRFMAFDKQTGDVAWISTGGRAYGAVSSPPLVTDVDGVRTLITGGGDGAWHALRAATGEPSWRYQVSRRGVNAGAIRVGRDVILSAGGGGDGAASMAALRVNASGEVADRETGWLRRDPAAGVPAPIGSPVSDGQRIYQMHDDGMLVAFEAAGGKRLWGEKVGPVRDASPVLADGKIYIGTEDGRLFVLRPRADGCDVLSETRVEGPGGPEPITAGVAVSDGRVYVASARALYAIGDKDRRARPWSPPEASRAAGAGERAPAWLQVIPADVAIEPGQTVNFRVRLFDAKGGFIRQEGYEPPPQDSTASFERPDPPDKEPPKSDLQWSIEGLAGQVRPGGGYTAPADAMRSAGRVTVRLGSLSGESRVRIIPRHWNASFEDDEVGSMPTSWVNAGGRFAVKAIDGSRVLAGLSGDESAPIRVARAFGGLRTSTNYSVEADVRFAGGAAAGDGGVLAQGYELALVGGDGRLELRSWKPETMRTRSAPFPVEPDTWYRLELRAELLLDGGVRARGRVWPAGQPKPSTWMVERTDPPGTGHLIGSPGVSGSGPAEVYFDNVVVTGN